MAQEKTSAIPPYVSFLTFTNLLDWLRDLKTIPTQFDRSFWGERYSGSTGVQLMTGLRFLGLLADNKPQERLEQLAFASNEDRREELAALLRDAYGSATVDGLTKMTPAMLNKAIQDLGTTDATHRKAISFFVNAAKAAEIPMPANIAKQARNKATTSRKRSPKAPRVTTETPGGDERPNDRTPDRSTGLPEGIHQALVPILADLPKQGPTWDTAGQARWEATFKAVLAYAYPAKDGGSKGD